MTKTFDEKEYAPMLGEVAKDSISGFTGIVRAVSVHNSGCESALLQPKGLDPEGNPLKSHWIDVPSLENYKLLPKSKRHELLGKKVRDTITGYEGIVVEVVLMPDYDTRVKIQGSNLNFDGVPAKPYVCNLSEVERLDKKPVKQAQTSSGSPSFLRDRP